MKVLSTQVGRVAAGILAAGLAVAVPAVGQVGSKTTAAGAGTPAAGVAACQSNEQGLGFGLNGTIKITVCPEGSSNYEVLVMTKDDGGAVLSGYTRVTGSNGTSYTGAWHYDGGQGFNEGLQVQPGTPVGTQYCGQFFRQPSQSQPVTTTSIPVCLNLPA